jgi:hypothetical protein
MHIMRKLHTRHPTAPAFEAVFTEAVPDLRKDVHPTKSKQAYGSDKNNPTTAER